MIKAIGWNLGQRGDIIMNTVVSRGFKEQYPDSHLTLGIYKEYSDMKDLFIDHPFIDDVHIYDSYNNWPNDNDKDFLKKTNFDMIYHGMPQHSRHDWYNVCISQTEEACLMNHVKPPKDLQCILNKWFKDNTNFSNFICIAPFSSCEKKDLSIDRANSIVRLINDMGYQVLQLSSINQPNLENAIKLNTNYFNSVVNMLSCRLLITINTGMSWVSSAYSHKTLGLYSVEHWGYQGLKSSSIYEPINPNAIYLRDTHPNNISLKLIQNNIIKLLKK